MGTKTFALSVLRRNLDLQKQIRAGSVANPQLSRLAGEPDARVRADNNIRELESAIAALVSDPTDLADELVERWPSLDGFARKRFMEAVWRTGGRDICENGAFLLQTFPDAEANGIHVLPVHYYSPIPVVAELPKTGLYRLLPESFDARAPQDQAFFDDHVMRFADELLDVPLNTDDPGAMRWGQSMFGILDSSVYYAMARLHQPKRILEVGSGFSTLVAMRAAAKNDHTRVECVEPFPVEFFSRHLTELDQLQLTVAKVQDVPLSLFEGLEPNDILFIDSSHVVKPGSDAEHLFFKVLPALKPGVIVHFHDIFLPYGYPYHAMRDHLRFWNENYVLAAMLAGDDSWEVLASNCLMSQPENLDRLCNHLAGGDPAITAEIRPIAAGGSMWIRRRAAKPRGGRRSASRTRE